MRIGVTPSEVLGFMESVDENQAKVENLKSQIKAINDDTGELTKITSADFEVKPKDLKKAYKQYQDLKKSDTESDFWELAALLEEALDSGGQPSVDPSDFEGPSDPSDE
jgi:hypothetical protein